MIATLILFGPVINAIKNLPQKNYWISMIIYVGVPNTLLVRRVSAIGVVAKGIIHQNATQADM